MVVFDIDALLPMGIALFDIPYDLVRVGKLLEERSLRVIRDMKGGLALAVPARVGVVLWVMLSFFPVGGGPLALVAVPIVLLCVPHIEFTSGEGWCGRRCEVGRDVTYLPLLARKAGLGLDEVAADAVDVFERVGYREVVGAGGENHVGRVHGEVVGGGVQREVVGAAEVQGDGVGAAGGCLVLECAVTEVVCAGNGLVGRDYNLCQLHVRAEAGVHTTGHEAEVAGLVVEGELVVACCEGTAVGRGRSAVARCAEVAEVVGRGLCLCGGDCHVVDVGARARVAHFGSGRCVEACAKVEVGTRVVGRCGRCSEVGGLALVEPAVVGLYPNLVGRRPKHFGLAAPCVRGRGAALCQTVPLDQMGTRKRRHELRLRLFPLVLLLLRVFACAGGQ